MLINNKQQNDGEEGDYSAPLNMITTLFAVEVDTNLFCEHFGIILSLRN